MLNTSTHLMCMTAIIAAVGCARPIQPVMTNQETQIAAAIQESLSGPQGGFVVPEEKKSGKFVQFARSSQESLILDLPYASQSAEEKARARSFLIPLGGSEGQHGFQLDLDRDADRASQVAMQIFGDVYQCAEPLEFKIQSGN